MSQPIQHSAENSAHQGAKAENWSTQVNDHGHSGGYEPTPIDLTIVGLACVLLVVALGMTVRYLFRPGEKGKDHIKRRILHDGGPQ